MERPTILLVNNNREEVKIISDVLNAMDIRPNLIVTENTQEALYALMGSSSGQIENGSSKKQSRPDIILLDKNLPEMSGLEFLEIIQKYYSLKRIKIFLLINSEDRPDSSLSEKFMVTGYLQKPFENNPATIEKFKQLERELSGDHSHAISALVFLKTKFRICLEAGKKSILKGKAATLKVVISTTTKIALCITTVSIVGGAISSQEIVPAQARKVNLENKFSKTTSQTLPPEKQNFVEVKTDPVQDSASRMIPQVHIKKVQFLTPQLSGSDSLNSSGEKQKKVVPPPQKKRIYKIKAIPDNASED
jgi:CheY-like chemotaxis protein